MSDRVTKQWHLLPHNSLEVNRLASTLRVSPLVAQLLLNRNLPSPEAASRFLESPLNGLHPPESLPGVARAAERILDAVREGRRICVYGDYDVDGVTGSAILIQGLRLLGAEVDLYVPHRLEEGYGLNQEALRQIAKGGASLVVTVDCGIASIEEAREARRLGLELIITDHHEPKGEFPDAAVVVHPRVPGTDYPFGWLSGSAVAMKLAWAIAQRECGGEKVTPRFREYLLDCVALAALGVVADVVPLQDENRILVRYGLKRLSQHPSPGIKALCLAAGIESGTQLRASDIGFRLAPRLNAAGRLGCARLVVDLLTTARQEHAQDLAQHLEFQNSHRQTLERRILTEARARIQEEGLATAPALILAREDWHAGIIGIVAGRLAELYGRPCLMISLQPSRAPTATDETFHAGVGLGSGRSIKGFALNEALAACDDLLVSHGGHQAAAGFRILPEHIDAFRLRFCEHATRHFPDGPPPPRLILDAETPLSVLTPGLLRDLDRLEPYGAENRKPVFLAANLQVVGEPRKVGQGERHLSFRVRQDGIIHKAIAWGMADRVEELMSAGGWCCLAFTPKRNVWQGREYIDLEVADFQPGPQAHLA